MPDRNETLQNWSDYQLVQDYMQMAGVPGVYGMNVDTGNIDLITVPTLLSRHHPVLFTEISCLIHLRAMCCGEVQNLRLIRRTHEIETWAAQWAARRNPVQDHPACLTELTAVEATRPYSDWVTAMMDAATEDAPVKGKKTKGARPLIARAFGEHDVAKELAKVYVAQGRTDLNSEVHFWSTVRDLFTRFVNVPGEWKEWVRHHRRRAVTGPVDRLTRNIHSRLIADLMHPINSRSVPPGEGVGIELEYLRARHREGSEMQILELPGVSWGWDTSTRIFPEDTPQVHQPQTNEVRLFMRFGRWRRLEEVCRFLRTEHCVAYPTCGLHVHLDQRHLEETAAKERYFRLRQSIHWLSDMAPLYRKVTNYAKVNYGRRMSRDRYVAVNWESYHEHKTIEVRFHSSSLDPNKIIEFVRVLLFVQDCPKKLLTLEQFLGSEAPRDIKLWVLGRTMLMDPNQHKVVRKMAAELVKDTDPRAEKFLSPEQIERIKAITPSRRH